MKINKDTKIQSYKDTKIQGYKDIGREAEERQRKFRIPTYSLAGQHSSTSTQDATHLEAKPSYAIIVQLYMQSVNGVSYSRDTRDKCHEMITTTTSHVLAGQHSIDLNS